MATLVPFRVRCPSCDSDFPVDPRKVPAQGVHAICSACRRVFHVSHPEDSVGPPDTVSGGVEAPSGVEEREHVPELDEPEPAPEPEAAEAELEAEGPETVPPDAALEVEATGVELDEPEPAPEPEEAEADFEAEEPEAFPSDAMPDVDEAEAMLEVQDAGPELDVDQPEPPAGTGALAPAPEPTGVEGKTLSEGLARFGRRDPHERARHLARVLVSDMITYHPARYESASEAGSLKEDFAEEVDKSWDEYREQVGEEIADGTDYFVRALNEILGGGKDLYGGQGRPS